MTEILISITTWLQAGSAVALPAAFLWGMVSVILSPCHMASIPLLIAYVGGQKRILPPGIALRYAVLFVAGLFLTIITIGFICTTAGRMLGDIGPYWQPLIGLFLLWVAWTLYQPAQCAATGSLISHFNLTGERGAFVLGLAYGLLSGVCTFGFIAPILGLITLEEKVGKGLAMLTLFAFGHCLPLVFAGVFSARISRIIHATSWQAGMIWMRRVAGLIMAALGLYFISLLFL